MTKFAGRFGYPLCIDASKLCQFFKDKFLCAPHPPTRTQSTREQILLPFQGKFWFWFWADKTHGSSHTHNSSLIRHHILIMPSEVCTRHLSTSLPTRIYLHACPWWQRRAAHQSPKGASAYSTNAMKKNPQSFLTLSYRARNNTFFLLQSAETWILEICKYYQIKKRRRPMITKNWDLI